MTGPPAAREDGENPASSFREFGRRGIDLYLTCGIETPDKFARDIVAIAEWAKAEDLKAVKGFTADVEWAHDSIDAYKKNEAEGDAFGMLRDMARIRALGFQTEFVGMFWEFDDAADGDKDMERFLQLAFNPEGGWDRFNYMIYRWDYAVRESPYFTYYYLNEMRKRLAPGSYVVSLGVTGYPPLDSLEQPALDVKIAHRMSAGRTIVFILDPGNNFPGVYEESVASMDLLEEALADPAPLRIPYTRALFAENMAIKLGDLFY